MSDALRWHAGDDSLRRALEPIVRDPGAHVDTEVIADRPGRRRLLRARTPEGDFLLKLVLRPSASIRRSLAEAVGLTSADREWRALVRLHALGVPVPEPLAYAERSDGSRILVQRYIEGAPLLEAIPRDRCTRLQTLAALGRALSHFHATGTIHRDLHAGNVRIGRDGPILLDLQASWRSRSLRARVRDLGALDDSLSAALSTADRVRVRAAALDLEAPFDARARQLLRAVGRASGAHRTAHARSRTRRSLKTGRAFARWSHEGETGLRARDVTLDALRETIRVARRGEGETLKRDVRSVVSGVRTPGGSWIVKEFPAVGIARRIADSVRGSPARRAWRGGHGLIARGIDAATPIGFAEWRRFGMPVESAIVLEDLRGLVAAHECPADWASETEVVDAAFRLLRDLHRRQADHGDLKGSHLLLERNPAGRIAVRLIDLEQVRFPRRLGDRARVQALAELNASLPDRFPAAARRRAFDRYVATLPFARGSAQALREVVELSLARHHRWQGLGCTLAKGAPKDESSTPIPSPSE